jgi:hypothetical protein
MVDTISGGCRCGAVGYTLAMSRLPRTYACHCLHCLTWSGSAFSQQAVVPEDLFTVTDNLAIYERTTENRVSRQRVCPTCFTRVFNTNTARPGMVVLRAGTLDDSHLLDVVAHIWVKRKQPWIVIPDGVPQWDEGAPLEAMAMCLQQPRLPVTGPTWWWSWPTLSGEPCLAAPV